MTHLLSRLSAPFARSTSLDRITGKSNSNGPSGSREKPVSASSPSGGRPHANKPSSSAIATQKPTDPWHTLLQQPSSIERSRFARYLSRISPDDSAWSLENGQRGKLERALENSKLACYDIPQPGAEPNAGLQFSASVHPTDANIANFVGQLYGAGTQSVVNLAELNEYGIKDPTYYNTGNQTIEIGDYLVRGGPVGKPVPLGKNKPSGNDPAKDITLRFYEATIAPKADADNPAAVHTFRAFEIDNLRDGTAFEPGQLAKLAMHVLKAGGSRIHVHCHGGFDRTGMTVALSQLIDDLLKGKRIGDPIEAVKTKLDNFRGCRGEWTAVQGGDQLMALINETTKLCAMPRDRLRALYKSIPALGVEAEPGGPQGRNGHARRRAA